MSPPSQPGAARDDASQSPLVAQLLELVLSEVERVDHAGTREFDSQELERTLQRELYCAELSASEEAALEAEPVAGIEAIAQSRLRRALRAGFEAAGLPKPPDDSIQLPRAPRELEEWLGTRSADDLAGDDLAWIRSTLRTGGDADDPLLGTLFHEKYRILRKIGRGGFGAVYEALDERGAHNRVAIKIMRTGLPGAGGALEIFLAEAQRLTRLDHPSIVDWKNFDRTDEGQYYLVMELLDGEELESLLKRQGKLDASRALPLLLQILDALRAAHFVGEEESILHLDLKPKNIIVLPERRGHRERIKVIDFGIGQYLGGEELSPVADDESSAAIGTTPPAPDAGLSGGFGTVSAMTTGRVERERREAECGFKISHACTPEYASPEQCAHVEFADGANRVPQPLDGRADLYSFGVIAHRMLTGRLPFPKPAHRFQYLELHQESPITPWESADRVLPKALRRLVERCLEKDPSERYADTQQAYEELELLVQPARSRTAVVVTILTSLLLVVLGSLYFAGFFDRGTEFMTLHTEAQGAPLDETLYFDGKHLTRELFVHGSNGAPLDPDRQVFLVATPSSRREQSP